MDTVQNIAGVNTLKSCILWIGWLIHTNTWPRVSVCICTNIGFRSASVSICSPLLYPTSKSSAAVRISCLNDVTSTKPPVFSVTKLWQEISSQKWPTQRCQLQYRDWLSQTKRWFWNLGGDNLAWPIQLQNVEFQATLKTWLLFVIV